MSQTGVVAETRSGGGRDLVFPEMTANEARALTDQIKYDAEALWDKIAAAYTGRAWAALGYESWDVYCIKEFGDMRLRLPREERAEMVCSLRQAGLSIRAIASGVGISDQTVQRDLAAGVVNHYTSPEEPDVVDAELVDEPTPTITGTDGKTYPQKRKSKREPEPVATADGDYGDEEPVSRGRFPDWSNLYGFVVNIMLGLDSGNVDGDYDLTPITPNDLPTEDKHGMFTEPREYADQLRAALPRIHELVDLLDQVAREDGQTP